MKNSIILKTSIVAFIFTIVFMIISVSQKNIEKSDSKPETSTAASSKANSSNKDKPITTKDWQTLLVNKNNPLPQDYVPDLDIVENGYYFDERAAQDLQKMLKAARNEGLEPILCSTYRSIDMQTQLYNNEVQQKVNLGLAYEDAREEAKTVVAYPGTSEHNLGLAADIVALSYQILDEGQESQAENKWLQENCYKYGFVLRYPKGKKDITGVIYEPWHFRYVGAKAASEIHSKSICLEEYWENSTP